MIDPALLRPGRLDQSLYCGKKTCRTSLSISDSSLGFPDNKDRYDILKTLSAKLPMTEDARCYLQTIATDSEQLHYTGADLQAVCTLPY